MRSTLQLILNLKNKFKSPAGFSITEVMISVGILSVIGAGVANLGLLTRQNTVQIKATRIALTQKEKIEAALKNPASWQRTLVNNINFRCLSEAPGCDNTVKNFVLYSVDPVEKLTFDPTDSSTRLTLNGEACPAATPDPSPLCPLKYVATWQALCITFPCLNPPVDLKIELQTSFENDRKILNAKNYDYKTIKGINDNDVQSICISMNGLYNAVNKTCRPKFAGRSCAAIGRPHQIVKDVLADGTLVCEPLFTGMCPGTQVMVGVNSDGSVMCGPQPVGSCPAPINCVGSWNACPASCGMTGTQTYTITTNANFGGTACPFTHMATQICSGPPCIPNQNCVGSFGACNTATGLQVYTQTVPQSGTGTSCPHATGYTRTCAVNCVGAWGVCSSGIETFAQSITAKNGGLACSAAHGATRPCGAVVVNGSCSGTRNNCAAGLPAAFGSTATHDTWQCQGSGGGSTASCSTPRAINCVGAWGSCSVPTCGGGTQVYNITTPASGGGSSCPYSTGDTQPCNTAPCAPNTNCIGSFGACDPSTGTQVYSITQVRSGTGTACPYVNGFTQNCPVNCVGSFSPCSGGLQTYTQTITAKNGGMACRYAHGTVNACGTNGACSSTLNTCAGGTPANFRADATNNIWDCMGSSGGTNALACTSPIPRPINGACGIPTNSCSVGSLNNIPNTPGWENWECSGSGGGSNASCNCATPPLSTGTNWCSGTTMSFSGVSDCAGQASREAICQTNLAFRCRSGSASISSYGHYNTYIYRSGGVPIGGCGFPYYMMPGSTSVVCRCN